MKTEELKTIVDGERTEQLTAQLCRHWEVATERLHGLVQELASGMDTCVEAEVYAALMRMQNAIMTLMKLSEMPSTFMFAEYLDRIDNAVSNASMRQSVMQLARDLFEKDIESQRSSFFELLLQSLSQQIGQQQADAQKNMSFQHIITVCAPHMKQEDLMLMLNIFQEMNAEADTASQEKTDDQLQSMRQTMEELAAMMNESMEKMLFYLIILMLLPSLLVGVMRKNRTNGKQMAQMFDKVQARVRESRAWKELWKNRRETIKVVSDSSSWKAILLEERNKERTELGQVPGGLFAKWTTNKQAFEEDFLRADLSDDDLRHFIFHLTALNEIARELDPKAKNGEEKLVNNEREEVAEAVLTAARKLSDLVKDAWFPHYDDLWKDLIQDETIYESLKVTRKSPHNNLFTARFFCHLVGGLKKKAVFDGHSDLDLANKLTDKYSRETYRKNIQEGLGVESGKINSSFDAIFKKYRTLVAK